MHDVANPSLPVATPASSRLISFCVSTLFLLAGLCAVALCCELSGCLRAAQPEKSLRAEPRIPKLKNDPAEPTALPDVTLSLPEPQPSAPEPKAPAAPGPGTQLELPALPALPAREEPPVLPATAQAPALPVVPETVEMCSDPLVYLKPCTPQLLESPMLRNWKILALYSLLAAAPAVSAQAQPGLTTKELEGISKRLEQLEKKDLSKGETLDRLQSDLRELAEFRKTLQATPPLNSSDLDKMKQRLAQIDEIRKELKRLDQLDVMRQDLVVLGNRLQVVEERKPEAPTNQGELRNDFKEIKSMLDKMIELQSGLQADVKGIKQEVGGLKRDQGDTKVRVDGLELQVRVLTDDLKAIQKKLESNITVAGSSPAPALERTLDDIRAKLASIEQALLRMQASSNRTSLYAPAPGSTRGTATGRVLLENFYPEELLFIVNGQTRRIAPNSWVTVEAVPTGKLIYDVVSPTFGPRGQRETNLVANETFRITAR